MPDQFDASFDTELEESADVFEDEIDDSSDVDLEAAPAIETSFGTVTGRLSEIAEVLEDETLPLDDALDLLEEAVSLGMQASNLLENDMNERDAADEEAEEAAAAAEEALREDDAPAPVQDDVAAPTVDDAVTPTVDDVAAPTVDDVAAPATDDAAAAAEEAPQEDESPADFV